jgi:hypothetical protein
MIRRAAELGTQLGHELLFLPMVRVFAWEGAAGSDVAVHDPGVRAMTAALDLRVPHEHFESPAVPAWLAVHSGGYMRDLLRLVIECIYRCPEEGVITHDLADEAIARVEDVYREGLFPSEIRLSYCSSCAISSDDSVANISRSGCPPMMRQLTTAPSCCSLPVAS